MNKKIDYNLAYALRLVTIGLIEKIIFTLIKIVMILLELAVIIFTGMWGILDNFIVAILVIINLILKKIYEIKKKGS